MNDAPLAKEVFGALQRILPSQCRVLVNGRVRECSVRVLTDEAGRKTDSYDYEAFGELLGSEGRTPNEYLFTGERFEAELGWYDLRVRFYDQEVGRFTQQDSFEGWERRPITLHKYLYANGDPVNWVDPTGNFALSALVTNQQFRIIGLSLVATGLAAEKFSIWQHFDSRKEVYLDFSEMNFCYSTEIITSRCWNKQILQQQIVDKIQTDYIDYKIDIKEAKGHFLQRIVKFVPKQTAFGVILGGNIFSEGENNGQSVWLRAWIYVKPIMNTVIYPVGNKLFAKTKPRLVTEKELGIAIGNVASHEVGHLYAVPHDAAGTSYLMTEKMDAITIPLLWSEKSKRFLESRF